MVQEDAEEDVGSGQGEQDFREAEGGGGGEVKHEPLKLESKMFDKRIDITDAKCEFCKNEVRPEIMITRMYTSSKKYMDNGNFVTYWHCDNCGAVPAIVNGEIIDNPLDLMDISAIRLNRKIFVSLRYLKSAVRGLLEEIERKKGDVDASLSKILKGEKKDTAVNRGALYGWGEALFWVKELVKKWLPDVAEEGVK